MQALKLYFYNNRFHPNVAVLVELVFYIIYQSILSYNMQNIENV